MLFASYCFFALAAIVAVGGLALSLWLDAHYPDGIKER